MFENVASSIEHQVTNLNPWLNIWFKPRITIRQIVEQNPEKHVLLLAMISGVYRFIDQASERGLGDSLSMLEILGLAIILGPIAGAIGLYLSGALFRWTGSWLGGTASDKEVRAVFAWSSVVDIAGLLIFALIMIIFGREWFQSSVSWADSSVGILIVILLIPIGLTLLIWRSVIFLIGLAEVHNFSIWKSLGATVLGFVIVIIPILCILLPVSLAR